MCASITAVLEVRAVVYPPGFVIPPPLYRPPPPPRVSRAALVAGGVAVAAVALVGALMAPRALRHLRGAHRPPVVRTAPEAPQTFSGHGEVDLPTFGLNGGDYDVGYRCGPGTFFVRLRDADEEFDEDIVSVDDGPNSGTVRVTNVPAGRYHLHAAAEGDAPWTLTVIPR